MPEFTALQVIDACRGSHKFSYPLKSANGAGLFTTKAVLSGFYDDDAHILQIQVGFDETFQGVSLPYNFYALLVVQNGVTVGWYDFTEACQGPGVGFFPGGIFRLPPIKLPGNGPLQVMAWGRL